MPESLHIEMGSGVQPVETHPGFTPATQDADSFVRGSGDSEEIASKPCVPWSSDLSQYRPIPVKSILLISLMSLHSRTEYC